jgi:hypothetical protein
MKTPDPTNWEATGVFVAYGIDVRKCVWCGDGFARIRFTHRPQITCSEQCQRENRAAYHRSPGHARGKQVGR